MASGMDAMPKRKNLYEEDADEFRSDRVKV